MSFRTIIEAVGFSKRYNFILWFIFSGAMLGFVLAKLMYLNYDGVFCAHGSSGISHAAPGQCYAFSKSAVYGVGIRMHIYTVLPSGLLAVLQFLPVLRKKVVLFHRINGYLVLALCLPSVAGAIMIAPVSFGGGLEIQAVVGFVAIIFLGSLGLALYNIKMLQIELHRAWMLRAWFYVCPPTYVLFFPFLQSTIYSLS